MEDMSEIMKQFSSLLNNQSDPNSSEEDNSSSPHVVKSDTPSINPDMVRNLVSLLNTNTNSGDNTTSSGDSPTIDFETILKMKSVFEKMNDKDDSRSKLLLSLKPYLKESRKSKLDQYLQFMKMTKVMDVLKSTGGEKNS